MSIRPAPDTMTWLTALLPVVDGVAVHTALAKAAETARCDGDDRGKGQVMADTLVERITGHPATCTTATTEAEPGTPATATSAGGSATGSGTKLIINLIMTDTTFLGVDDEPAMMDGYGVVPAGWARGQIADILDRAATDPGTRAWIRRLYVAPESGALIAMESRGRRMPPGLRDLIRCRDQTCRVPWCDAPIAHDDHLNRHTDGGPTSETNGAGLCAAHNLDRETPGYHHVPQNHVRRRRRPRHSFTIVTPTGHRYTSTAPAPLGTPA